MNYLLVFGLVIGYGLVAAYFVARVEHLGRFLLAAPMIAFGGALLYFMLVGNTVNTFSEFIVLCVGIACAVGGIRFVVDLKW